MKWTPNSNGIWETDFAEGVRFLRNGVPIIWTHPKDPQTIMFRAALDAHMARIRLWEKKGWVVRQEKDRVFEKKEKRIFEEKKVPRNTTVPPHAFPPREVVMTQEPWEISGLHNSLTEDQRYHGIEIPLDLLTAGFRTHELTTQLKQNKWTKKR